jgi:glycosyltransferase involved in cell wall biosynthesis
MKMLFVARSLHGMAGGVERMITTIMNAMSKHGHEVDLLTWDQAGAQSFYAMDSRITWHRLNMGDHERKAGKILVLRRAVAVRNLIKARGSQVVICFQDGPYLSMRLFSLGMGIPVIAAERNAPTRFDHTRKGRSCKIVTLNAFRFARKILLQCEEYRNLYPRFLQSRIEVIPNPVFPAKKTAASDEASAEGRFRLLSVGRLGYQKNYECLLQAFASLAERYSDWDLEIVGEGESRDNLERMVADFNLSGRVVMNGVKKDLEENYANAHLFCLPSKWEGFPNALGEAFAHALPAVGFAGCAGVNSLINHGQNGLLAEGNGDSLALAQTLDQLMADPKARAEMGKAGKEAMRTYAPEAIFAQWERVIREAAFK